MSIQLNIFEEFIPNDVIYQIKFIIGLLTNELWYSLLKYKGFPNVPPLNNCSLSESLRLTQKNYGRSTLFIKESVYSGYYKIGFYMDNAHRYGVYNELLGAFCVIEELNNFLFSIFVNSRMIFQSSAHCGSGYL